MSTAIDRSALSQILSDQTPVHELARFTAAQWEQLVLCAGAEGLAPLLYWKLSQTESIHLLPERMQLALRAVYAGVTMTNAAALDELERLAQLFARAKIPVVVLKGACFALTIYPEPGLRPMSDVDLLLPASQLPSALEIARSAGYEDALPEALPGLNDLLNHAVCLKKTTAPFTTLELHDTVVAEKAYRHAVPVDWFWNQTEPIGATPAQKMDSLLMLTPTAQLLYASAHAMLQHGGRNTTLRWYYDLDRLVRVHAERIDWELLLSQARLFEWSSAVLAALSQAARFFATPVPPDALEELAGQPDRNSKRVAALQEPPATHILAEYQDLQALHWNGKIRMFLALVAPGAAYMRWRYGIRSGWVLPAWYLYRWWGICKDGARTVIHLLQARAAAGKPAER